MNAREEPAAETPAATPAPAEATATASSTVANPDIPCSSHQASVGSEADACDYTPDLSGFKKAAYNRVYMNNSTTNATYAAQISSPNTPCTEHQDNAMDCSFSPSIQAWST